jgi:hypothetical protein
MGPSLREAGRKGGENAMLFVTLLSTRPGFTFQEGVAKRLQWEYPEGANVRLSPASGDWILHTLLGSEVQVP